MRADGSSTQHPLLGRLNIPSGEQHAIEDFGENIQYSQIEQEIVSQGSAGRGPAIPFLPQCTVEVRLNS